MDQQETGAVTDRSWRRRLRRGFRRAAQATATLIGVYALVVLVGLIPVNNDFAPAVDGVKVYLVSNPVHADLVLPIANKAINWRQQFPAECFAGDTEWATHVAIGWGDQGFFLQTRRWADLRASVAAKALLWPSEACMHVAYKNPQSLGDGARSVTISAAQYERLVDFVTAAFKRSADGACRQIGDKGYGSYDAFFEAHGTYHCANTCNSWVGNAMQSAGIRTAWLTPLPKTVFLYLPD